MLLVANLVNAVLEVLFVFGFDWGVPGSARSTVIAQVGAGVAFAVLVRRHLAVATDRRPSRAGMAPLLTAGRHLLLRVGSMLAVTTGATAIAARVDEPTLAAHQIVASMFLLLALVLDALAIPAQTLVADELGQGSVEGAAELSHRRVRLSIVAGAADRSRPRRAPARPARKFQHRSGGRQSGDDGPVVARCDARAGGDRLCVRRGVDRAADYRFLGFAAAAYLASMVPALSPPRGN